MEETVEYNYGLKKILYFAIGLMISAFFMLIIDVYFIKDFSTIYLLILSIILLTIAALIATGVVIKSIISEPIFMDLEAVIIKEIT